MTATSDHFDGRRFFNPTAPEPPPFTAVPRMLLTRQTKWPSSIAQPQTAPTPRGDADAMVTAIGHSTFLIQTAAATILTDPVYSERAGPFNLLGPRRVRRPAVAFDDLPRVDLVLLSHSHYDHCDRRTLQRLAQRFDPLVITPLGNAPLVHSMGIRRVEELDWWEASSLAPLPVVVTRAHHFSARTPFDRNRALWGGFMVTAGTRRLYFAGDTAYVPLFREIRERLGAPDLALIPIGAYEPRWFMRAVHMNPAEAVQAHVDLESAMSIGMHFGTFQLTAEGIGEPVTGLADALRECGVPAARFRTIAFGESFRLQA